MSSTNDKCNAATHDVPTMQFGLLVCVGTSYTLLNQLLMMQRKIPRII